MNEIQFIIPGVPKGKDRPRFNRYGQAYSTTATTDYEKMVKTLYLSHHGRQIEPKVPVSVHIVAFYQIPKSANKAQKTMMREGRIRPMVKPDVDNVEKIILDALNKIAWHDDSQVVQLTAEKQYSDTPRVVVTVETLPTGIEQYREGRV